MECRDRIAKKPTEEAINDGKRKLFAGHDDEAMEGMNMCDIMRKMAKNAGTDAGAFQEGGIAIEDVAE
eukprot:11673317-Alexandrium_andersonii.AAC.1